MSLKRFLSVLPSAPRSLMGKTISRHINLPCGKHRALQIFHARETESVLAYTKAIARHASSSTSTSARNELLGSQSPLEFPDISNHYSIFPETLPLGPPPNGPFGVNVASLRREFLKLQGRFHPDKFSPTQKAKAAALSSRINEAYKVLRDPLLRAQFLLLYTYDIDVTLEDNNSHPTDPNILMEVMEAQEAIEEAETEEQISLLKGQNQERIDITVRLLDHSFSNCDSEAARMQCIRLRYWVSLAEGLNSWDGKGSEVRLMH